MLLKKNLINIRHKMYQKYLLSFIDNQGNSNIIDTCVFPHQKIVGKIF